MIIRRCLMGVVQRIYAIYWNKQPSHGKVLTFHRVCNNKNAWDESNCSITTEGFLKLIDMLKDSGAEFGTISQVCEEAKSNMVWLTFDDAYEDVYTNAYPIMRERGIPFTVFLSVDFLDQEKYIKMQQVKEMLESGLCTIGAHTVSHRMLRNLNTHDAEKEILAGKTKLEALFNTSVTVFAYPYGSCYACKKSHQKIVRKAGYKAAFSTIDSTLTTKASNWFLPRINVSEKNYLDVKSR